MSAVAAVTSQAALTQLNISMAVTKKSHEMQQNLVEMIAASVDSQRGGNLNISV